MKQPSIVALGEPMIEFNQIRAGDTAYRQGFGGDTSNFAIAAARQGTPTACMSRLGTTSSARCCDACGATKASTPEPC